MEEYKYFQIDVAAGCKDGYTFVVKVKAAEDDIIDRRYIRVAADDAGLFNGKYDCYGCSIYEIGDDAFIDLNDFWLKHAVEVELND